MTVTTITITPPEAALPPVSDEAVACIEALTDTAFWKLMLGDDLAACGRDVDLLCASIKWRFAQILASYKAGSPR